MNNGDDVVTDFKIGQDKLVIRGADNLSNITLVAQGKDTLIDMNHDGSILLQNVKINDLQSIQSMVDKNMLVFDTNSTLSLF